VSVRAIGHPVIWMGRLISALDRRLNRPTLEFSQRRAFGVLALTALVVAAGLSGDILQAAFGTLLAGAMASSLLAQRSLYEHVARVAAALEAGGVEAGREAVSHIVGRDPQTLDEAGVARAAIESLAENFSDGVVAPAFWIGIGGLPGGAIYKAVNTADSMIGHRSEKYLAYGWASARLDDLLNLPASRLSALLIVGAARILGLDWQEAWRAVRRDAPRHRSPNAGWPEAAMAGALGLALAGPRSYGGVVVEDGFMGDGRREADAADIRAALRLFRMADTLGVALVALLWLMGEREQPVQVQMRGDMGCQRIQRRFDTGLVVERRRPRGEAGEPGRTLGIRGEESVHIGAEDPAIPGDRALGGTIGEMREGACAVRSLGQADMHLVAGEIGAIRGGAGCRFQPLLAGSARSSRRAVPAPGRSRGGPFQALRIGELAPEHLVAAAKPEHRAAAPHMGGDIHVEAGRAQAARSAMVALEPGMITRSASPGNGLSRAARGSTSTRARR
jgi:adenosylcobinamide-phosphate synthase